MITSIKYVDDIAGFTEGSGGNPATNATALNNALATYGGTFHTKPGALYKIGARINMPPNSGIVFNGASGNKPIFFMPVANFTNTNPVSINANNACLFSIQGMTSLPYTPLDKVRLEGFIIESEIQAGRSLCGIHVSNAINISLNDLEMYGFPNGKIISFESVRSSEILRPYIHDCTESTITAGSLTQLTGILIGDNAVNNISCSDIIITNAKIWNLTLTGTALTTYGWQTDGINIANHADHIQLDSPNMYNVGEAIDCFGQHISINNVKFDYIHGWGLKFIHLAQQCSATGGSISRAGLGHIALAANSSSLGDVKGNTISGITCYGIGTDGFYGSSTRRACLNNSDNNGAFTYKVKKNKVSNCTFDATDLLGIGGHIYTIANEGGTDNDFRNNVEVVKGVAGSVFSLNNTNLYTFSIPTLVRCAASISTVISSGSSSKLIFDALRSDTRGEWSSANNRWTCTVPGAYEINTQNRIVVTNPGDIFSISIRVNGSDYATERSRSALTSDFPLSTTSTLVLSVGDYIEVWVTSTSTSACQTTGNVEVAYLCITPVS